MALIFNMLDMTGSAVSNVLVEHDALRLRVNSTVMTLATSCPRVSRSLFDW